MYPDLTLKERVTHGTSKNPLMALHFSAGPETLYPDRFFAARHWHSDIELILVRKGAYLCETNLETFRLEEGHFAIVNSEELHQLTGLGQNTIHDVILFSPDILDFSYPDEWQEQWIRPFLNHELAFPHTLMPDHPAYPQYFLLFDQILQKALAGQKDWYIHCKLLLLNLFVLSAESGLLLSAGQHCPAPGQHRISRYKTIISYMEEHFQEPVTLKHLADAVPCNPQYLCRFFKELAGISPIQYLINYRIQRACGLLANTSLPILQIAMDCGFDNVSYFIRKFKEARGCTPKEFRRLYLSSSISTME
ncbi:MAG: AraC family transcriptional regulator [Hungatella sp.]|nr:AraC family transcriptional regulator [Hungatella sp.]